MAFVWFLAGFTAGAAIIFGGWWYILRGAFQGVRGGFLR